VNSYTHPLTSEQAEKLRGLLRERGFAFAPKPYTIFFAQKNKLSVAVYEKGPKILVQGKGIEEFVQFELEPKILGEAKLGWIYFGLRLFPFLLQQVNEKNGGIPPTSLPPYRFM